MYGQATKFTGYHHELNSENHITLCSEVFFVKRFKARVPTSPLEQPKNYEIAVTDFCLL